MLQLGLNFEGRICSMRFLLWHWVLQHSWYLLCCLISFWSFIHQAGSALRCNRWLQIFELSVGNWKQLWLRSWISLVKTRTSLLVLLRLSVACVHLTLRSQSQIFFLRFFSMTFVSDSWDISINFELPQILHVLLLMLKNEIYLRCLWSNKLSKLWDWVKWLTERPSLINRVRAVGRIIFTIQ